VELYRAPDIHRRLYPMDDEERAFFSALPVLRGRVLDLGCGDGSLAGFLAEGGAEPVVGIDLSPTMLSTAPTAIYRVRGDIANLPIRNESFDAVVCRLYGISYALGAEVIGGGGIYSIGSEIARVTVPGGRLVMEAPMAHRPASLAGVRETSLLDGLGYSFDYLDVLAKLPEGVVLDTRILARDQDTEWELRAPIFVFSPGGAADWLSRAGFSAPTFCAAYDLSTETRNPPLDCLRAIVLSTKRQ